MDDKIRHIRTIGDPAKRALRAAEHITKYQEDIDELATIRREAILELVVQGVSKQKIAEILGTSKARISQIINPKPNPKS